MWSRIKEKAKQLIGNHGPEIITCVKIAAHALLPGGVAVVETVAALCDYTNEKGKEISEAEILAKLETLGNDQTHLLTLLDNLTQYFGPTLTQMSTMAQFNMPEEGLQQVLFQAIEHNPVLSGIRSKMIQLQSDLDTIKQQNLAVLEQLRLQGDMGDNVQSVWEATNALQESASKEELKSDFMMYQSHFQSCMGQGQLELAKQALDKMKAIQAQSDLIKMSEALLESAYKNFEKAERIAQTLSSQAQQNAKVQKATHSLTSLTRAGRSPVPPSAQLGDLLSPAPSLPLRLKEGQRIGDKGWILVSMLGRGGMGEVWSARNSRNQQGAIKLMKASLSQDQAFVQRFQVEIDALDRVTHVNVIDILDWGEDRVSRSWYFVMPYLQGQSLRSKLKRGVMDEVAVKTLVLAVAEGLVACHAQGVIHRDIKPENIMFDGDRPVLIDFGIAHQEDGVSSGMTGLATSGYAPPEQLSGRGIGPEADLYALGMTAIECFGGARQIPKSLSGVFEKITHSWPSRRGSASELVEVLKRGSVMFHVIGNSGAPEEPIEVKKVVALIVGGKDELLVWREGLTAWVKWSEDDVLSEGVRRARLKVSTRPPVPSAVSVPPPAPEPKPVLSLLPPEESI